MMVKFAWGKGRGHGGALLEASYVVTNFVILP